MENKYLSKVRNLKNQSNLSTLEVYLPYLFYMIKQVQLMESMLLKESHVNSLLKSEESNLFFSIVLMKIGFFHVLIADTDKIGPLATRFAPIINWMNATGEKPRLVRKIMETILGTFHTRIS